MLSPGRCPKPLKNRDFITLRSWLPMGSDYIIMNYSVKHPVSPWGVLGGLELTQGHAGGVGGLMGLVGAGVAPWLCWRRWGAVACLAVPRSMRCWGAPATDTSPCSPHLAVPTRPLQKYPPRKDMVRAVSIQTGYLIQGTGAKSCTITYLAQVDPRGKGGTPWYPPPQSKPPVRGLS